MWQIFLEVFVQNLVLIDTVISTLEKCKMCPFSREQQLVLTTAALPRLHVITS